MRLLKQAMAVLGTVTMIAVLVAVFAPKTAHAVAAALVQIEPGTTTHVGQNEGSLVALDCFAGSQNCSEETPSTGDLCCVGLTAYVVPAGYTFVVTDFSWSLYSRTAGDYACDFLLATNGGSGSSLYYPHPSSQTCATADQTGLASSNSHFTTGLRFVSGATLLDDQAAFAGAVGYASVQGYLVPN